MVSTKAKWGIQVYSWGQNPSKFNLCFIKISVWILWRHLLLCLLTSQFNPIIQLSNCNLLLAVLFHCYITVSSCLLDLDICSIQTITSRYLLYLDNLFCCVTIIAASPLMSMKAASAQLLLGITSTILVRVTTNPKVMISLEIITTDDHLSHQLVTLRQGQGPLPSARCCSNGCPERITLTRTF